MRTATVVSLALMLCTAADAEEIELLLQDGLQGYAGTEDFMMYQPSSVANVNYGRHGSLSAGINRWDERLASIVRFDLSGIPPTAEVHAARLIMHARPGGYPFREVTVTVRELTEANAGWVEGTGDGTRVPTPGAPCWNWRRYDTDRWAGEPGAAAAGADYSTDWSAQAPVPEGGDAEVVFELPARAVQRWIERPGTNAGLRLWPEMAAEKGDVAVFFSAEAEDRELRPALALVAEADEAAIAVMNRNRARRLLEVARDELDAAAALMRRWGPPETTARRLRQLEQALRETRAALLTGRIPADIVPRAAERLHRQRAALDALRRLLPLERAREWIADSGGTQAFALGVQHPTVKVFREAALFEGEFAGEATVRLARNEHEAVQVAVVPLSRDLQDVTWEVRGLDGVGLEVSVAPVGYVRENQPAYASVRRATTWWPDPILDYLTEIDEVPRGEVRPLWVDVHAGADARPGLHQGELVVRAAGGERRVRLRVEVFDFALPVQQHLKTIWGMSEGNFARFYEDRYDDEFAWQYFDMFLEHRISPANLYRTMPTAEESEDSIYHLASVEALQRLKQRGSGWWNVGYVLAPQHALSREPWEGMQYEQYLQDYVQMLRPEVQRVRQARWPEDRVGLYFLDETSDFEALGSAAEAMKAAFPEIPLMTTGYDRSYGLEDTPVSRYLDIWVPLTPRYHEDLEKIVQGRELGKQIWWYICVGPRNATALNWFVEFPAIRARLLMGAASRRYRVDGFLYYRVAGWASNDAPIIGGPITDWNPVYRDSLPDGDGQIICAGPDGPLTTVRLENIRDGIEDYEYWWLLDELIASTESVSEELLGEARARQQVPDELLTSVHEYSEDPDTLARTRLDLARTIERLRAAR
ncbi:MAG: glycoside hydrolase domain-containing protein [Armatimonadota bacterium]